MTIVHLPAQLRELADGNGELELEGNNVKELIDQLESRYPKTSGWLVDETGAMRPHVKVFVNGEAARLEDDVAENDELRILPAISGGDDGVELLVGTRKGLFVLRGARGGSLDVATRAFEGQEVEYAMRDPRSGTYLASVTHGHYGPRVFSATDPSGEWQQTDGPVFPNDAGAAVTRIWKLQTGEEEGVVWAGVAPAALFKSTDGGRTWALNEALWNVPGRAEWEGGAGGLCLHSIATWPGDPQRLAVGISAAGVWLTEDGGASWRRGVKGIVPGYLPEDLPIDTANLCVHNMHRSPAEPATLYMQFHGGVYRSDDAGESWNDIGADSGLPSDFGFPMVVDPRDPARAWVIPLVADIDRVTPEGKVRVYETADRGETWNARASGLPSENAYLTILRQAFCHDGRDPLGLYFGATSGEVFGSADAGASWTNSAAHLPPVLSVRSA